MEKDQISGHLGRGENMAVSKAQQAATAKYEAKAYDKVLIRMPKGRLDEVKAHSEALGSSVNGFINEAILDRMEGKKPVTGDSMVSQSIPGENISINEPDVVKAHVETTGETVGGFVNRAISETISRDKVRQRLAGHK